LLPPATTTTWEVIIEGNLLVAPIGTVSAEMAQACSRPAGTEQLSRKGKTAQVSSNFWTTIRARTLWTKREFGRLSQWLFGF
jgi:hypothetical protein